MLVDVIVWLRLSAFRFRPTAVKTSKLSSIGRTLFFQARALPRRGRLGTFSSHPEDLDPNCLEGFLGCFFSQQVVVVEPESDPNCPEGFLGCFSQQVVVVEPESADTAGIVVVEPAVVAFIARLS